jgi:hypothetical protein
MKSITKPLLYIPLCWLLIAASCKKDDTLGDGLPPLTFEGKNTIGCKINGVPWVPKGMINGTGIIYPTSGGFYGTAFFPGVHILLETNSPDGFIELFCRNYAGQGFIAPGKFFLNKLTGDIHFGVGQIHSYGYYRNNGYTYFTDSLHTGWIELLKSDSLNSIVSGRFEFDAYNATTNKVYHITEGRFDYKSH